MDTFSSAMPDGAPIDQSRDHPNVDCSTVNHVFVTAGSATAVVSEDEIISFPDFSRHASSRVVAPALPPPNA